MRGGETYFVVVCFFTAGDFDGSGAEIFPDEGALLGFEKRGDVRCPLRLGAQHAFGILSGEVLDDSHEGFCTNLVPKYTQVTISLWDGGTSEDEDFFDASKYSPEELLHRLHAGGTGGVSRRYQTHAGRPRDWGYSMVTHQRRRAS